MAQQPQDMAGGEVAVLDIPNNTTTRINFITKERTNVIQGLAQKSKGGKGPPDLAAEPDLYRRLDMFLRWLDEDVEMTPEIKQKTKIDAGLKLMFGSRLFKFRPEDADRAHELYQKFEEEKWGASAVVEDEMPSDGEIVKAKPETKRRKTSATTKSRKESMAEDDVAVVVTIQLPPPNHPIWGKDGIMHGVAKKGGKKRIAYVLDPRYRKRNSKVYGHNGIAVDTWYPFQVVALARGAHGSMIAGISGDQETGAYSVVVAGHYHDLDRDTGYTLYYSGSNSHDNTDPKEPAPSSSGTRALQNSLTEGRPVRVLRSASGKSEWAPRVGIRYDGLYQVVDVQEPLDSNGGRYEQFKLTRLPDQPPINKFRPSSAEFEDSKRIAQDYR